MRTTLAQLKSEFLFVSQANDGEILISKQTIVMYRYVNKTKYHNRHGRVYYGNM